MTDEKQEKSSGRVHGIYEVKCACFSEITMPEGSKVSNLETEEAAETKEKDEHRGTEHTEGHGEELEIWMEKAKTKA